jgi:glyoxylase-like metal-dependent hydrolase (beta-lactamase superfamily II)/8-oxo-dGTP pyrophosphatase MutT (NUDIX family)
MPIVDAVTAILCHRGEIYMVRRHRQLAAFPGYQAFPGGKVDLPDADHQYQFGTHFDQEPRLFRALMRELEEELGVAWRFEAHGIARDHCIEQCRLMGVALTPPHAVMRFNTRFFRLDLSERPQFSLEARELESGAWATPQRWIERYQNGELLLAPPTRMALETLAQDFAAAAIPFDFESDSGDRVPVLEMQRGVKLLLVRSNTVPPAQHTNCFLIGDADSRRVLIDPSPASREELAKLQRTAGELGFDEIFITHHHPDHQQFANELARSHGVPIGMSADTQARICARSPYFLDGLDVKTHAEGDFITRWNGHEVRVLAVPGHDEGQLALMPENRAWCIVSDLIQGIGTVVIAAPEGDMRKYFASLERVIAANPAVIYPSHGMPLGGVFYLEQTLQHRRLREAQVSKFSAEGRSVDEMLTAIYVNLDAHLVPLARKNIESHLSKLQQDAAVAD